MSENSPEKINEALTPEKSNKKSKRTLTIILGLLFVLPALTAFILTQFVPTIMTFVLSFRESRLGSSGEFVGFDNYMRFYSTPGTSRLITFTLLLTVIRVLVVLIPPLLLALGVSGLKSKMRNVLRIIATMPWMVYSPLALSIVWMVLINPNIGIGLFGELFYNPETSRWLILLLDGLSFFGLACGLGMTVYLSAIKGVNESGSVKGLVKNLVILAAILIFGTIALSLQGGESIVFMTNGFPEFTTMSAYPYIINLAFALAQSGLAAALASPLIIIVALLGIAASLFIVFSNIRLFILPKKSEPAAISKGLKIFSGIMTIFILLSVLFSISPYLLKSIQLLLSSQYISFEGISSIMVETNFWRSLLNTWSAPLVIVFLVQLPITYLAALGIGALRPFGKSSEWLLLLFAPWLFIRVLLYVPGLIPSIFELNLGNSFIGLTLPYLLNIPMLFILTLFFRGQSQKLSERGEDPKFFRDFVLASLPLAVICVIISVMTIQQDLSWPSVILSGPDKWMLPVLFRRVRNYYATNVVEISALFTLVRIPAVIAGFLILGASQVFFFPRLGICVGRDKGKKQTE